ncbi:MAG: SulP family inorganic anion transporter [Gammaproteobacteria bacterium]|nr:MAG: SulP family inorganic anion transporter [Gammaproteobacteria bacterium]UCH41184.1 MAG: SulP family inorganic anion transporter [Gammaproteobacteria bacterium]
MNLQYQLNRYLPFMRWGRNMTRESMRADAIAGLTGAAIVLPQGVAFAAIAGMPPEYGLYTSMVPAVIAALFGSSWHLVSGPTTAASVIMFASLSGIANPGSPHYITLAITLAFMVGVLQLAMGIVRLGALVNFISHSVVVGFTAGAACLIAAKQASNFFGISIPAGSHLVESIEFLWLFREYLHPLVSVVAVITLLAGILAQRRFGGMSMIVALIAGSAAAGLFNLVFGAETTGIKMVGALPQHLPPLSMPDFSLETMRQLSPLAFAMTLFALTEAVSIARSISLKSGQAIDGNQEFIGQGLSNIFGSFFSSYVATGSFNRSGANYDAGARTPLAAILAGILLVVIVMLVAPLTSYLPKAAVAGLLFLVAWRLINFSQIRKILRADRNEAVILCVVFFGTVFFSIEFAILAGVILSLTVFLRKTSRPRLSPRVPDPDSKTRKFVFGQFLPECPQLKILRLDDSLYFGSVSHVGELLRRYREHYPEQKHLFLLTKGISQVDIAGAELLVGEARERRAIGGDLYIYRLRDTASKVLKRGGYADEIGESNIFDGKLDAISSIFGRLDKSICATCENRIFLECQMIDKIESDHESESESDTANKPDS